MESKQATNIGSPSTSKRNYWVHLAGVSLGILCLNTSFCIFFFIMTSLHYKQGLGSIALAVNFVIQVLTGIFLPPFVMRTIGCKWALVLSGVSFLIFAATNLKSKFETLIPGVLVGGIGYTIMFATMNTVVSDVAVRYARLIGNSEEATLKKFFSISCGCFTMAFIWANLISSEILSTQVQLEANNKMLPQGVCGAFYCDLDEKLMADFNSSLLYSNGSSVPQSEVNYLVAASLGIDALGIIIIVVLLNSYNPKITDQTESSSHRLWSSFRLFREPDLLLLIPLTINSGLMFSFLTADFTKGFVKCSLGIHFVGLAAMFFGIAMCLGTFLMGLVSPFIPRIILFLIAVAVSITDLLLMLLWTPDPQSPTIFYVIAAIWGSTFSVWLPQLCALYAAVFPNHHQEAYSHHRTWYSAGFAIGFAWSHYLCISTKLYIIIGTLIVGTFGYMVVEKRLRDRLSQAASDMVLSPLLNRVRGSLDLWEY